MNKQTPHINDTSGYFLKSGSWKNLDKIKETIAMNKEELPYTLTDEQISEKIGQLKSVLVERQRVLVEKIRMERARYQLSNKAIAQVYTTICDDGTSYKDYFISEVINNPIRTRVPVLRKVLAAIMELGVKQNG